MQPPRPIRRSTRVSGKRVLLILAILALLTAGPLYWALLPLYTGGKQSLRTSPPATEPAQAPSTDE